MKESLQQKLQQLPVAPGVYFHKDAAGTIIYVGKAAVLKNRVRQYFQRSSSRDPKTEALVTEIADTDWMVVDSEIEALFLEAEMIRRYMPRYNILLRDDKSLSYIRIDYESAHPTLTITRRPLDDGARYYGPYLSTTAVRRALRYLRKIFPYSVVANSGHKRASLYYHIGLDPGLEEGRTTLKEYRANLRKLMAVIEGKRTNIVQELEREMKRLAAGKQFEEAAVVRNRLQALRNISKNVIFSDKEFIDISKDHALTEMVSLLSLKKHPRRIEGYDISHMQGTDVVASMVVFTNGVSDKSAYRKFKTKINQNNDFYNMNETIRRRLSDKNKQKWGMPDLVLIDGGKGQLDAAIAARDEMGCSQIPFIGLAKREEQIVIKKAENASAGQELVRPGSGVALDVEFMRELHGYVTESANFLLIDLPQSTNLIKLLQRIRDESHRFAVTYHSVLRQKRQTASRLDDIPTIGPATRKKLLTVFGSLRAVQQARHDDLVRVVGAKKAALLVQYLRPR